MSPVLPNHTVREIERRWVLRLRLAKSTVTFVGAEGAGF